VPIAAPSGTGKTTVCRALLERHPDYAFSVSLTTREPRRNERDGVDYHFVSKQNFEENVRLQELAEWEQVFDNYYGTLKSALQAALAADQVMLFDIDVKGAGRIKNLYPEDTITIFLLPPNEEELNRRLRLRGTETRESISIRQARIPDELKLGENFDYHIVNDKLDETVNQINKIIEERIAA